MGLRRSSNKEGFSLDLTTCSDIIFTLLLFYILTQNFMPQTPLELPTLNSSVQNNSFAQQRIEISALGKITWNGRELAGDSLRSMIADIVATASGSQILILAHRQSPAGSSIELLDQLRNAGVTSIAFAGTQPEGEPEIVGPGAK